MKDVYLDSIYPLVICYIANWKIAIFNGKIHNKWPFSIAMLNYQRVDVFFSGYQVLQTHANIPQPNLVSGKFTSKTPIAKHAMDPNWQWNVDGHGEVDVETLGEPMTSHLHLKHVSLMP